MDRLVDFAGRPLTHHLIAAFITCKARVRAGSDGLEDPSAGIMSSPQGRGIVVTLVGELQAVRSVLKHLREVRQTPQAWWPSAVEPSASVTWRASLLALQTHRHHLGILSAHSGLQWYPGTLKATFRFLWNCLTL